MLWTATMITCGALAACGHDDPPARAPDAEVAQRHCDQGGPATAGTEDVCNWDFTCSDYAGVTPQYALHCERLAGRSYTCTCKIGPVQAATITLPDACSSATDMCSLANSACGWQPLVDCPR
jgi:hypothetical protein